MRVCQFRHFGTGRLRVNTRCSGSLFSLQKQLPCSNSATQTCSLQAQRLHSRLGFPCDSCLAALRPTSRAGSRIYNLLMTLSQQVQKDMVDAMRKKEELRLST